MILRADCWKPPEDELLRERWYNTPTRKISEAVGKSYKAVSMRAYRLRLGPKKVLRPKSKKLAPEDPLLFEDVLRPGITLHDHREGQCCWPVHKGRFCGENVIFGQSYCYFHKQKSIANKRIILETPPKLTYNRQKRA